MKNTKPSSKLEYFKDNFQDEEEAEDFDPQQYYYKRSVCFLHKFFTNL